MWLASASAAAAAIRRLRLSIAPIDFYDMLYHVNNQLKLNGKSVK